MDIEYLFIDLVRRSDLVGGVYEGGFKLWECATDLIVFLLEARKNNNKNDQTNNNNDIYNLRGKRVLEVGQMNICLRGYIHPIGLILAMYF